MKYPIIPKEISWLSFNERVLQEAANEKNPLLERLKYLGIYSNNLDEFFRVRVAILKRLLKLGKKAHNILGYNPKKTLKTINEIVLKQNKQFENLYPQIIKELTKQNIFIINEKQLTHEQQKFLNTYFYNEVQPELMPIMLKQIGSTPLVLTDDTIYFAIELLAKKKPIEYALLKIPISVLPRFIVLPSNNYSRFIILLDDVIRLGLKNIFSFYNFDEIKAYTIKLTKDAELDIVDNVSEGYIKNVMRSLKERKTAMPVRFIYDEKIPDIFLEKLKRLLKFSKEDTVIPGGKYHNFKDFFNFPVINNPSLYFNKLDPIRPKQLLNYRSLFWSIKKRDLLLYFPYQSFNIFIDLLREVSIDPNVLSIKITLYRIAENSRVINALLNAVRNGKSVTAVIELQARFDEEANIYWGNKLSEAGVKVIYGIQGLKVHAKLCFITRKEENDIQKYACIGTGNFNENTAKIYTDHLLFTADKSITNDVEKIFNFFKRTYDKPKLNHIILSPFSFKNQMIKLIKNEIRLSKLNKKAYIYLKLNNLTDPDLIQMLYKAGNSGVTIKIIVRGMCSLVPEAASNIEAIGIVDRFLEHTRFFIFGNDGKEKIFISSADWMTRNIERRVEATVPIYDIKYKKQLMNIFNIQWNDQVKARIINEKQNNQFRKNNPSSSLSSQIQIYDYIFSES